MTSPKKTPTVKLRPEDYSIQLAQVAHVPLIIDSWASDQMVNGVYGLVDRDIFRVEVRARILRLISSCRCAAIVPTAAYTAKQPVPPPASELFGWACYGWDKASEKPVLHYVYIRQDYRNNGLARRLLKEAVAVSPERPGWASFIIPWHRKTARRYGLVYNPFLHDYRPGKK